MRLRTLFAVVFLTLGVLAPTSWAQMRVRVNWSAVSGSMSGIWVAYEEGIFKRNRLDVELIHISSTSRAIQTMLAGEIHFAFWWKYSTEMNFIKRWGGCKCQLGKFPRASVEPPAR